MLPNKLVQKPFEQELIEYSINSFPMKFLYAEHTDDEWSGFIPHSHEDFELLYVISGKADININGTKHNTKEGDVFVINPAQIHSCMKTYPGYKSFCMQFHLSFLSSRAIDICEHRYVSPLTQKRIFFKNHYENDTNLRHLFDECEKEYRQKNDGYHIALKGYLYAILTLLYRRNDNLSNIPEESHPNRERVNLVITYIAEHYAHDIDFRKIVKDMYLDYSYFSRLFKSYTGKSMFKYLKEYRISKALTLLTSTNLRVTDIATQCGFDDLNYFSKSFRTHIGYSPQEVRKSIL